MTPLPKPIAALLLLLPNLLNSAAAQGIPVAETLPETVSAGSLIQVVLSLAAVLVMFAIMVLVLRRVSGLRPGSGRNLRIIEGISLGSRERILLIECGKEQILVGVSAGRMQTLKQLEQPVQVQTPAATAAESGFARVLQQLQQRF